MTPSRSGSLARPARGASTKLLAAAVVLSALGADLHGQANEQDVVSPAAGTASQRFGAAMVVQDDVLVVGAPYEDTAAADGGAVFVFRWDATTATWVFEQQLFASDAEASARFGSAVAVDVDAIVVGAPFKDTTVGADAGQIYVFRYDAGSGSWSQEQKLKSSIGNAGDTFGSAVGISGNLIVSGSPKADTVSGVDSGVAVAYRYKNSIVKWVEEKQLVDSDAAGGDLAGSSIAVAGSVAFVASPNSSESTNYGAGSIAVWDVASGTWTEVQEITASTPKAYSAFGTSLRLAGDLLAVTAPLEDETSSTYDSGAAYLFRSSAGTWSEEVRLTAPTPTGYEQFGTDCAVRGELVAIGSQMQDVASQADCGAVHLFRKGRSGWVHDVQLGASDSTSSDHLGVRVAIADSQILAAADGNDTAAGYDWGVVDCYAIEEITLSIEPAAPLPDEAVTFSAFRGAEDDVCMITIEDVSGTPLFLPLLVFVFAADNTLTFTIDAPNPAYGLHVGMRAYKISPTGPVVFSELAYVDV